MLFVTTLVEIYQALLTILLWKPKSKNEITKKLSRFSYIIWLTCLLGVFVVAYDKFCVVGHYRLSNWASFLVQNSISLSLDGFHGRKKRLKIILCFLKIRSKGRKKDKYYGKRINVRK